MHLALATALLALATQTSDPTIPANLHTFATVEAHGVQIYTCGQQGNAFQWILKAPDATLFDPATHQPVGTHSEGPQWTWKDGSVIQGKVLQKVPSPDAKSIPWLLLEAQPVAEHPGELSKITRIRRSDTQAGSAPADGCSDGSELGDIVRVPYQATYTFYY